MAVVPSSSRGASSGVSTVAATDASIVVAGTASAPTIATASLATIASLHASAGAIAANSQKITGLANGTVATDAAAFGQITAANAAAVALSTVTATGDLIVGTGNATVGRLAVGAAGTVLGGGATPGYVNPPGFEINYTQIVSTANITDTAEATATALISPGAVVFDGAAVIAEFFTPQLTTNTSANGFVAVTLFEGAAEIARLGILANETAATSQTSGVTFRLRFTPSAGSHTYKVCAWASAATGTPAITAGNGGTNGWAPAFIRFTKV